MNQVRIRLDCTSAERDPAGRKYLEGVNSWVLAAHTVQLWYGLQRTTAKCVDFVLDFNPRFIHDSIWPRCLWTTGFAQAGQPGTAVIFRIGRKPGDYLLFLWKDLSRQRFAALLCSSFLRLRTESVPNGTSIRSRATGIRLTTGLRMEFLMGQLIQRPSRFRIPPFPQSQWIWPPHQ